MRLLLDTHILFWFLLDQEDRLTAREVEAIRDADNAACVSVASYWEAAIKSSLGELALPKPSVPFLVDQVNLHRFEALPIEAADTAQVERLPALHRDPFDRLIVAQALRHGLTLLTRDAMVKQYPAKIFE